MNALRQYVGLIFLSLILSGCIPIPVYEDEPYSDEVLNLKVGSTTKNDILNKFGEPGATYSRESKFVYTDFQVEVGFLTPLTGSQPAVGQQHFLILSFDEDGVLSDYYVESSPTPDGCNRTGWCFGFKNRVARLADAEQDAAAKQFLVSGNQCGIYVYDVGGGDIAVSIDGEDMGSVFGDSFFQHWKVDPGTHEIALLIQPGVRRWGSKTVTTLALDCAGGELFFVHPKTLAWSLKLEQVNPSEGRKQIEKRRLLLSGPMRKIPDS